MIKSSQDPASTLMSADSLFILLAPGLILMSHLLQDRPDLWLVYTSCSKETANVSNVPWIKVTRFRFGYDKATVNDKDGENTCP